jgi:hypothetical protein
MQNTNISLKISQLEWQLQQDIKAGNASPQRILMVQQNIDSLRKVQQQQEQTSPLGILLVKA